MTVPLPGVQQSMRNICQERIVSTAKRKKERKKKRQEMFQGERRGNFYDKRRSEESGGVESEGGEWKCKDCVECSRVNCK